MKKATKKFLRILAALAMLTACAVIIYGVITGSNLLAGINGWWTLLLIVPGLCGLFHRGSRLFSFGLIIFGGIMLLSENAVNWLAAYPDVAARVADINWMLAAGVVLLFIAALSILGSVFGLKKKYHTRVNVDTNGDISFSTQDKKCSAACSAGKEHSAVFSDQDVSYSGQQFTGAEFNAIFSRFTADLTGAIIENDCTIEANGIFGTLVIKTGTNANYRINASQVLGTVSSVDRTEVVGLPTVTVNANSIFGSVEIV